ncbi:MAG: class I SAM-dependent methyltransferase [Burkholderiales bacterium]|nr:class I SAM-dependent methyltransferase [Burkholderiales bacterium]
MDGDFSPELLGNLYSNYYPRSALNLEDFQPHQETHGFKAWLNGARSGAFRWVPRNVRVLDIGCGFGESLGYHQARGCDVYGVEADMNIRRVADKFGFKVHVGLFDPKLYAPNSFDYVTMSQVIEHVTDPVETLRGIAQVLRLGGAAILSTPNANGWGAKIFGSRWINWHTPYHLQFFSIRSLELAAEKAGLIVERIETVTSSSWLCYQWIHLLSYPGEGAPSSFWSVKPRSLWQPKVLMNKIIMATQLILLPQLITRFVDFIGRGDSYLIVLKKVVEHEENAQV